MNQIHESYYLHMKEKGQLTSPLSPLCWFTAWLMTAVINTIGRNNFYICWRRMLAKSCRTALCKSSHPALQKDWGKGMENTWTLPLSSALLFVFFSCLRVFYQCYQVWVNFSVILFYAGWYVAGDTVPEKFRAVAVWLILLVENIILLLWRLWEGNLAVSEGILNVFYWSRCSWLNPLSHGIYGPGKGWVIICFLFFLNTLWGVLVWDLQT